MTAISDMYRISLYVTPAKAKRLKVKKQDSHGKYVDLDHPWSQENLKAIKMGRRMVNLAAQGVSDADDIIAIVNKPRGRRGMSKPPTGQGLFAEEASKPKVRRR